MSYDAYKTTPPADADGGGKSPLALFRRNYDYFARQNKGAEYLDVHRAIAPFFEAIAEIESDPDRFCQQHGRPLVYDNYWRAFASGCSECEPGDSDGEAFRGSEAGAFDREQMVAARRLK